MVTGSRVAQRVNIARTNNVFELVKQLSRDGNQTNQGCFRRQTTAMSESFDDEKLR